MSLSSDECEILYKLLKFLMRRKLALFQCRYCRQVNADFFPGVGCFWQFVCHK